MAANDTPVIPYTNREFSTALTALKTLVQSSNGALVSDFSESSAGMLLLTIAAATIDVISAGQDFAALEAFLSTCRTMEAALRFAKSVGYVPRSASPASVTVVCDPLPDALASGGTVAAGQTITLAGIQYRLLADVAIPASQTVFGFTLSQVQVFSETFLPTNQEFQRVTVANGIVAQDSWHVFVGDATNPDNEWTQTEELLLLDSASNSYSITFDAQGRLIITFGNGISGAIPTDTITINYHTTQGAVGNVPVFAVVGALTATVSGGTSSLTVSNTQGSATGGEDRETLAELKRNIPAYIRTNQRVVTLDDFEDFLGQQDGVARVYADVSVASYQYNVVKCHVWSSENITFTAESRHTGLTSTTPYTRYAQMPPDRVVALHQLLGTKTMATVHSRVLRPTLAQADLYVGDVRYDPRFDKTVLHQQIAAAVVGVFEAGTGFTVPMSEINNAIRDVTGVRRFNIERIVFDYLRGGYPVGAIIFNSNPADGDTVSIADGVLGYAYEFDSNAAISTGRVRVAIGNSAEVTATNLISAINQTLGVRAYRDPTLSGPTVGLIHSRTGESFNLPIIKNSSALTVSGFTGGTTQRVLIREDRRLDQSPIPDPYPIGTYTVGSSGGSGWANGGVAPYLALRDLEIRAVKSSRNIYDEQYFFNEEIRYDSGVELTPDVQAINLRRLVVDLVPDVRSTLGF